MTFKILQTNLGRGRAPHDLAYATAKEKRVDMMLVSEPNKKIAKEKEWITDEREDVAVLVLNKKLPVIRTKTGKGFVGISFEG
ncbi:hypothetical protein QE152_g25370 [Popillia japonica]|uniref:Uncharacterized protein n=1 Tax=Popillia japonica TaxID=7064 RepID=A0AAW1K1Y5_POPJA